MIERAKKNAGGQTAQVLAKLATVLNQCLRITSLVGILLLIEPLAIVLLFILFLPYLWFKWRLAEQSYQAQHRRTLKQRWANYYINFLTQPHGLPEIKLLNLSSLLIDRFRNLVTEFLTQDRHFYQLTLLSNMLFGLIAAGGLYALFLRIAQRVLTSTLTVGDVAIYSGSAMQLQASVQTLVQTIAALREQLLHLADVQAFLAIQPSEPCCIPVGFTESKIVDHLKNGVHPMPSLSRNGKGWMKGQGVVEFDNVSFTYPGRQQPTLFNLSFRLEPGETVALVGENGAGKSTLAKLLARLYEPTTGAIYFNRIDLRNFDRTEWQSRIGFVFQQFNCYEATAGDVIGYGNWQWLGKNPAEITHIAQLAQADTLIANLPDGYNTLLGRLFGNYDLSQGQWQKLAVARALARPESVLLILDEPSASLDIRTEHALFGQFRQMAAGRTTLLISHRLSTISLAERVLLLERGRLVEYGSHPELLARNGRYATLYHLYHQQVGMVTHES